MIFKTIKEKCEYYRSLTDYRLLPNSYTIVMIDGKNFSTLIKNKCEKPFDDWFIATMNSLAVHLCKKIQSCVGAFVQSDEISLLILDDPERSMPFDGRICKLQSIIPSIAGSFFTRSKLIKDITKELLDTQTATINLAEEMPDYAFDCKVWNVPSKNDAVAWFLYRQIDCIRNSKQQYAQAYLSHNALKNLDTDKQIAKCLEETGNDWNLIDDEKKYGRFYFKILEERRTDDTGEIYYRSVWNKTVMQLTNPESRDVLTYLWKLND